MAEPLVWRLTCTPFVRPERNTSGRENSLTSNPNPFRKDGEEHD
jgi:hypothetical protein